MFFNINIIYIKNPPQKIAFIITINAYSIRVKHYKSYSQTRNIYLCKNIIQAQKDKKFTNLKKNLEFNIL